MKVSYLSKGWGNGHWVRTRCGGGLFLFWGFFLFVCFEMLLKYQGGSDL